MFDPNVQRMGKDALATTISFNAIKNQGGKYLYQSTIL